MLLEPPPAYARTALVCGLLGGVAWVVTYFLDADGGARPKAPALGRRRAADRRPVRARADAGQERPARRCGSSSALALPTLVWGVFALVRDSVVPTERLVDAVFGASWSASARCCVLVRRSGGRAERLSDEPSLDPAAGNHRTAPMRLDAGSGPCCAGEGGDAVELTEADAVRRVAMISVHTSPLDQPGTGDAGGMNVYVIELSRRLAAAGIEVDIFTRATVVAARPGASRPATASPSATSTPARSRG